MDYDVNWQHAEAAKCAGLAGYFVDDPAQCAPAIEGALRANQEGQPALFEVMAPWDEPTPGFCEHHDVCSMEEAMEG